MEPMTADEMKAIVGRLAWTDGSPNEAIMAEYELDADGLDIVMNLGGYGWNYDSEIWESRRKLWRDWDGTLPSE